MSITPEMKPVIGDTDKTCIEIDELYTAVVNYNQRHCDMVSSGEPIDINHLLKESRIVYRSNEEEQRSAKSELELMRMRAEERKYQKSIANLSSTILTTNGASTDIKSASDSVSFATHFIFAFASAFLLGYYFAEYGLGITTDSYKYICGGAASFLTLIIESLLFIIREEKRSKLLLKKGGRRSSPLKQSVQRVVSENSIQEETSGIEKREESIRKRR